MANPTSKRIGLGLLFVLAAAVALVGCGGDSGGDGGGGSGGSQTDVIEDELELRTDSRVVEEDVRDEGLIRSDEEAGEYVFDAAVLSDAGVDIEAGNVLLIAEEALIRVTSATVNGSELVVVGDPATLPELVDGRLSWDLALGGDDAPTPTLLIGDREIEGVRKQGSIDYSAEVGGLNVSLTFTPTSSRNEFSVMVTIEKGVEPAVEFRAVGTGRASGFRHLLDVAMASGETSSWSFSMRNLDIEMEVEMAGANTGNANLAHVLPDPFALRIPIPTALPLGLNIKISFGFVATLELPTLFSASTQASATFRYGGNAGFSWEGAAVQPGGTTSSDSIQFSDPNTAATQGPASATIGLVPRFSLDALLDQASVRIEPRFILVGNLRGDPLSGLCIEIGVQQSLVGVATASFFGVSIGELEHEFYNKFDSKDVGECSE